LISFLVVGLWSLFIGELAILGKDLLKWFPAEFLLLLLLLSKEDWSPGIFAAPGTRRLL